MDAEIGEDGFFEGGFESFDKTVRKVSNKADGVGDEERLPVGEIDLARGGVEGGEEHVFRQDVVAGELVEQGGLAGVGVADNGGVGCFEFFAGVALGGALLADVFEFTLGAIDADVSHTAVDFDLLFTHAASGGRTARSTTTFAVEVAPHACEAGEGVLHAGELDLQPGFAGFRALRKDIEDDLFAVDHTDVGSCFPLALLGGGELVVEDDAVAVVGFGEFDDFGGFAGAAEELAVHRAGLGEDLVDDADAEGVDEFFELLEEGFGLVGFAGIEVKPH